MVMEDAAGRLVGVEIKANDTVTGGDFKEASRVAGFALPFGSLWSPLSS